MDSAADDRRLADLYALDLHEGERHETFDRVARIAAHTFGVPIALVTFVDDDRQWFCGIHGTDTTGNQRDQAFCDHTLAPGGTVVVPDASLDPRFRGLEMVAGPPHLRFYAGCPVATPSGSRVGTLCILDVVPKDLDARQRGILRDLADLVEAELAQHGRALTDPMTELANRRAFMSAADRFIELGRRRDEPVSMLFVDVNGLKRANDTYGHRAGDSLIRRTASILLDTTRRSDLVARLGGDEFGILLFGSDEIRAGVVRDGIQSAIDAHNVEHVDDIALSLAIGAATAEVIDDVDALVSRADAAMYSAKRAASTAHA